MLTRTLARYVRPGGVRGSSRDAELGRQRPERLSPTTPSTISVRLVNLMVPMGSLNTTTLRRRQHTPHHNHHHQQQPPPLFSEDARRVDGPLHLESLVI